MSFLLHSRRLSKAQQKIKAMKRELTGAIKAAIPQNKRKNTPPPPTPLQLPTINLSNLSSTPKLTADELFKIIASFPRYGPRPEHAQALGIKLISDTALEHLVPSPHLPPPSWLLEPPLTTASSTFPADSSIKTAEKLSNGKAVPDQAVFWTRLHELLHNNDVAFRYLDRQQLQTDKKVYIANFRKFWDNLRQMAGYWDATKDEYDPPSPGADGKQTYTGSRIGNGANMPAKYREDAVQQFVQPVCWEFDCKVAKPFFESKLQVRSMDVPASCSGVVYRYPLEKEKRRSGKVQGPLVGVSARNAVKFRQESEKLGEGKLECLDVVREVGLALNIAQKRAREGKAETKTWEGKWWAEKPRWGGGEGIAFYNHPFLFIKSILLSDFANVSYRRRHRNPRRRPARQERRTEQRASPASPALQKANTPNQRLGPERRIHANREAKGRRPRRHLPRLLRRAPPLHPTCPYPPAVPRLHHQRPSPIWRKGDVHPRQRGVVQARRPALGVVRSPHA